MLKDNSSLDALAFRPFSVIFNANCFIPSKKQMMTNHYSTPFKSMSSVYVENRVKARSVRKNLIFLIKKLN